MKKNKICTIVLTKELLKLIETKLKIAFTFVTV